MSPQAGFILQDQICPRLGAAIPKSVLCIGSEDHQELVHDGITMAANMLDRVERQGKLGKVTPSNIAYYTIQHLKSGRRSQGSSQVDVLGSGTQLNGSAKLHSIHEIVSQSEGGEEIFELQDVISNHYEDPGVEAARRLDWAAFMISLNRIERVLIQTLLNGLSITDAAVRAKVSYDKMQQYRKNVAVKLLEFMGADILKDIAQTPYWKIGLDCERELLTCRADRRN
jgi:hypothetical protein